MLRLPQITGYVLGGVLVGPFGLNLLRAEGLPSLAVVRLATCLAHRRPAITGCPTLLHTLQSVRRPQRVLLGSARL